MNSVEEHHQYWHATGLFSYVDNLLFNLGQNDKTPTVATRLHKAPAKSSPLSCISNHQSNDNLPKPTKSMVLDESMPFHNSDKSVQEGNIIAPAGN